MFHAKVPCCRNLVQSYIYEAAIVSQKHLRHVQNPDSLNAGMPGQTCDARLIGNEAPDFSVKAAAKT